MDSTKLSENDGQGIKFHDTLNVVLEVEALLKMLCLLEILQQVLKIHLGSNIKMTIYMFKTNRLIHLISGFRTRGSYQACNLLHTTMCYEHLMVICHLTLPILPLMLLPHLHAILRLVP